MEQGDGVLLRKELHCHLNMPIHMSIFFNITSRYGDVVATTCLFMRVCILHPRMKLMGFLGEIFLTTFLQLVLMQEFGILVLTSKGLQFVAKFKNTSWNGWFIRASQAMMTRASLLRETKGVVVEMVDHVFNVTTPL
jgi:hypothetical protein